MHRRAFIGALASDLLLAPFGVHALSATKLFRIGWLSLSSADAHVIE